jgi:hypothetical protein
MSIGGYADYLLYRTSNNDAVVDTLEKYNKNLTRKGFNLGIMLAAGLEKQIGKTISFFVEGRFQQDFFTFPGWAEVNFNETSYSGFSLGIGVNFKLLRNK